MFQAVMRRGLLRGILLLGVGHAAVGAEGPPPLADALAAGRDVWGELAMQQPNGASYEFFEPLLPPPKYVNADFRYYPLVLSAPQARAKARLISNGSGVNLRGGTRSWKDVGTPVVFRVGPDELRFGELPDRLTDPAPAEGWLPIYAIEYRHPFPPGAAPLAAASQTAPAPEPAVYRLEAFASTDSELAEHAVVFVKFSLARGSRGIVTVQLDGAEQGQFAAGALTTRDGGAVVHADRHWKWERQGLHANLSANGSATLAIATRPLPAGALTLTDSSYPQHRERTAECWRQIVARAIQVEVPEARINAAWRNLIVQNFMLASSDRMLYSAGNQYEALYESEGSDAAQALLAWGYAEESRRMLVPLLDFSRKGLENHQAGHKLNNVARYWWQTRDTPWVREMMPRIRRESQRLLSNRDERGLLPKERYCGDIATAVHSLAVEAKAWRALADLPPVLAAAGEHELAQELRTKAAELHPQLLAAVMASVRHETTPPFVPIALLDQEGIHDPITATRLGSYWNLIINYVIGGRIFAASSPEESWIPRFVEEHGGLCMGMTRAGGAEFNFWTGKERVNPLYGTRYALDALRRDDVERALVSLYGMLAQGFTRNTLIAGEGATLAPVDERGRFFYCPPNSAGNAHFLSLLRNLLVQEWDLDDDAEPETLRLLFGTSRRWLAEGQQIVVQSAPTAFGEVSLRAHSQLSLGIVLMDVDLPKRHPPKQCFLRARIPAGWRVAGAAANGKQLTVDERGSANLTGLVGPVRVQFQVVKDSAAADDGP